MQTKFDFIIFLLKILLLKQKQIQAKGRTTMPSKPYYFQLNFYKGDKKDPRVVLVCANFSSSGKARAWAQRMQSQALETQRQEFPGAKSRPKFEMKAKTWPRPRSIPITRIHNPGQATIGAILGKRAFQHAA